MVDRERFQDKIRLQKTKNIISKIEGIHVIYYKEQHLFDEEYLREIHYLSNIKIPDAKISYHSNESEIIDWIFKLMNFQIDQIWYIWVNGFLVKFQILDIRTAILGLWKYIDPYCKGFSLIDENKKTLYEFGNDSRDEENYLYDKYLLVK